jgi:2-C-methyl-D-erythritol 2,4-cyclodiphosphate synthase
LTAGAEIVLGGVRIPFEYSLAGHSDADVLLHAITDALLGAAAVGDIGDLFPDSEAKNHGRSSVEMLQIAYEQVRKKGFLLSNLDCILFAEKPKLGPLKQTIRERLAEILEVDPEQINLKAKTGEKVGPIGRMEAISAEAIVLLQEK